MSDLEDKLLTAYNLAADFMRGYRDVYEMSFVLEIRVSKSCNLTYRAEFVPSKGHPRAEQRRGFGEVRGKDELDAVNNAIKRTKKEIEWHQNHPPKDAAKAEMARREEGR